MSTLHTLMDMRLLIHTHNVGLRGGWHPPPMRPKQKKEKGGMQSKGRGATGEFFLKTHKQRKSRIVRRSPQHNCPSSRSRCDIIPNDEPRRSS